MKPYFENDTATIYHGDCREILPHLRLVDTVITDPPYGLEFMGKGWDHSVPSVAFWETILVACKPGAMLLAFGGTRTFHRLTCAIEDAGFEIRDCLMWVYGSGFPKSLNVSKAIDQRRASNEVIRPWLRSLGSREKIAGMAGVTPRQVDHYLGEHTPCPQTLPHERFIKICKAVGVTPDWAEDMYPRKGKVTGTVRHSRSGGDDFAKRPGAPSTPRTMEVTLSATDAAKEWDGWGTALKPAWEPIILAMKPLGGTFAENAQAHGVAGLNIDAGRIPLDGDYKSGANGRPSQTGLGDKYNPAQANQHSEVGRWPANVIHDGSDEVVRLMRSADRFFYCAKASRKERGEENDHPTVKPLALMRYLCMLTATPTGGVVLDPFMGSGTTLVAARQLNRKAIGIEIEEKYCEIAARRVDKPRLAELIL